jgi:hypothetical protein
MMQCRPTHRVRRLICELVLAAVAITRFAPGLQAQANMSTQGFGYPTGQLSSRAAGSGGSIAEVDPLSPINPASLADLPSRTVFFQIEPEFRSVTTANGTDHTTTARYPVVFGAVPVGNRWVVSLGSSTLLDRTSTTTFTSTQPLSATESVDMTTKFEIDGAMNDVRLGAGWAPARWLRVGVGAHAIAGHNRVSVTQTFADTVAFSPFSQTRVLSFSGGAVSAGFELVSKLFTFGASARHGGTVRMSVEDTVLSHGDVPTRFGASLSYTGLANSFFSIRTSRDNWSSLGSLGEPGLRAVDAWDTSVGADVAGPHVFDRILFVRAGYRDRTLPFEASGNTVTEKSVTGGLGTTFANNRILTDVAVIRATRSANIAASEHAWSISLGFSVRP